MVGGLKYENKRLTTRWYLSDSLYTTELLEFIECESPTSEVESETELEIEKEATLASGARSKTRPAWQSLARPGFPGFWPSLPGKGGLVKPGKPGHGHVFLSTLATKVRLSRPC